MGKEKSGEGMALGRLCLFSFFFFLFLSSLLRCSRAVIRGPVLGKKARGDITSQAPWPFRSHGRIEKNK
jgi:hypothetical protein